MLKKHIFRIIILFILIYPEILNAKINVVAAENFYGNVASLIGNNNVHVKNIIKNPNSDPHLFTSTPSTAVILSHAQIIIYNGLGFDPWINNFINNVNKNNIKIINVSKLLKFKKGSNPHIWYRSDTLLILAKELQKLYSELDPKNKSIYKSNLNKFLKSYESIFIKIKKITEKHTNIKVTATESVVNYLLYNLNFKILNIDYQKKIMNHTQPSAKITLNFINTLTENQVKILFHNKQVKNQSTKNIVNIAKKNGIATIGVTETLPENINVITWQNKILNKILNALQYGG
jgi:zinc/manganese transport system substrate-binding protein